MVLFGLAPAKQAFLNMTQLTTPYSEQVLLPEWLQRTEPICPLFPIKW